MSAVQAITTCVTLAIPRLVSLFKLRTAGLKNLMRLTIDKQMKMQNIYAELSIMTDISTALQVELKTLWESI